MNTEDVNELIAVVKKALTSSKIDAYAKVLDELQRINMQMTLTNEQRSVLRIVYDFVLESKYKEENEHKSISKVI